METKDEILNRLAERFSNAQEELLEKHKDNEDLAVSIGIMNRALLDAVATEIEDIRKQLQLPISH